MIKIQITVTSINECVELLDKLKEHDIQLQFKGSHLTENSTEKQRKIRQDKILDILRLKGNITFDLNQLRVWLKEFKVKINYKTLERDLFGMEIKGMITKTKTKIKNKHGGFKLMFKLL